MRTFSAAPGNFVKGLVRSNDPGKRIMLRKVNTLPNSHDVGFREIVRRGDLVESYGLKAVEWKDDISCSVRIPGASRCRWRPAPRIFIRNGSLANAWDCLGLADSFSGVTVLLWCAWDFYSSGKGTLAPWDPPKKLVTVGVYRFIRNPMYVGVAGCVAGWSLVSGSPLLAAYVGAFAVAFHLRIVLYEEPTLARQFGSEWTQYCASVNRWLPGLRS